MMIMKSRSQMIDIRAIRTLIRVLSAFDNWLDLGHFGRLSGLDKSRIK